MVATERVKCNSASKIACDSSQLAMQEHSFGIFGGTFDPPHVGHAAVLAAAWEQLELERIYVVVANDPWQKSATAAITPAEHRLAMCEAMWAADSAATGSSARADGEIVVSDIVVSDIEIARGAASHTIDTVLELQRATANAGQSDSALVGKPVLLVGSDVSATLDTWHRADELRELVVVAIAQREGTAAPPGWQTRSLAMDLSATVGDQRIADVSSSAIRAQVANHPTGSISHPTDLLAPAVIDYITAHGLYSQR